MTIHYPISSTFRRLGSVLAASSALAACAVGPNYAPPQTSASAAQPFIGGGFPAVSAAAPAVDQWWRLYDDPVLDGLITDALASNTDIRGRSRIWRRRGPRSAARVRPCCPRRR